MNIVLEYSDQVPWYTDMAATLMAAGVDPKAYDWYVSDVETNVSVPLLNDAGWVTGADLSAVLERPIQFIWAVFSAFPPGVRVEVDSPPGADGNPNFWRPPEVSPQLSGACFEIVCWDSSATILIGVSQKQSEQFSRTYPDAKPLSSTWPKEEK
jgi:hypothetical protein